MKIKGTVLLSAVIRKDVANENLTVATRLRPDTVIHKAGSAPQMRRARMDGLCDELIHLARPESGREGRVAG